MKKSKEKNQIWKKLYLLEHIGFGILLFMYFTGYFCGNQCNLQSADQIDLQNMSLKQLFELSNQLIQAAISRESQLSTLNRSDVQAAPSASMEMDNVKIGNFTEFHDDRGDIYKFKLADDVVVNMYKTVKGFMRSGDLHNCTQYDISLKGRAILTIRNIQTGQDEIIQVEPYQLIVLPPRMAHMFEFLEDNYLLEWWSCDFQAWYYPPFRSIIDAKTEHLRQSQNGK
eukprot:TRINITY_DN38286_c0_g1_i1.p1 TRINITY_DN38286_c0_g1~~TRINITY_DN38286_c0_g1_i1.p1  ORF type:complete len:235 (-),score=23.59 TRINITY_DN38286_c0_g1_i1:336-1016(-)